MQPIISAGNSGYDLIVPSDYMVSILIAAGSIQPLNKDAIPNFANLRDGFTDPGYDPGNTYSAPYQWGTTGLAVNAAVLEGDFDRSWGLIFDPDLASQHSGQISLLNDPRETMGAALKSWGTRSTRRARKSSTKQRHWWLRLGIIWLPSTPIRPMSCW